MNCAVLGFQIFAKFAKVMREFGEMRARDFGLLILFSLFVFFFFLIPVYRPQIRMIPRPLVRPLVTVLNHIYGWKTKP